MSVGSVRQRGQEGRPVLFPQQGSHCITVVRQTQVCLDRVLDLPEEKKNHNNKPIRWSYTVCLFMRQHTDYTGPFYGPDFETIFSLSLYVSLSWSLSLAGFPGIRTELTTVMWRLRLKCNSLQINSYHVKKVIRNVSILITSAKFCNLNFITFLTNVLKWVLKLYFTWLIVVTITSWRFNIKPFDVDWIFTARNQALI